MTYNQETQKYQKRDLIAPIAVYLLFVAWAVLSIPLSETADVNQRQLIGLAGAAVLTAIVFGVVLLKKQGLRSLGLHGGQLAKAAILGLIFAIIPIIVNVAVPAILLAANIYENMQIRQFSQVSWLLFYFFIMAAYEDIFFVGFLQTRLYGVFKTDRLAISVGAALFALVHVPVALIGGMSLVSPDLLMYLAGVFFMHQAFVLLFRRYFSLVAVILLHTITNWSYTSLWIWGDTNYSFFWASIAGLLVVVAINIWDWRIGKNGK
ncbi:MAG: CPBP family intramembrane metalloprotease [Firmicutes bacterium]|nr:CPBP family intramembrane metalloprotease [Bacillota bacterium]